MLTLLIETFNNIDGLKNLLAQIQSMVAGRNGIKILIVDDASDLQGQEIVSAIPEGLKDITEVKRNQCHIGFPGIMANMFIDTRSKWCMPLTDGSVLRDGALDVILSDLEQFGDEQFGLIEYNTFDIRQDILDEYLFIDSLESFSENIFSLSEYGGASQDDVQIMLTGFANKVFNIEVLSPFASYAYQYAGSFVPGYIAVLKALECRNMILLHHNTSISEPQSVLGNVDIRSAAMGITAIRTMNLKTTKEVSDGIIKCFSYNYMTVISDYISGGLTDQDYLEYLYNHIYKYCLDERGKDFFEKLINLSKTGEDILYLMDLLG